eukprot:2417215-Prorocentrum_lima.AAC.1
MQTRKVKVNVAEDLEEFGNQYLEERPRNTISSNPVYYLVVMQTRGQRSHPAMSTRLQLH